jgi:Xaa-Pro aminopeptidase
MFYPDLTPFGVDMARLKRERLARLQDEMKRAKLGALLLTDFLNVRYATNTVMMLGLRATGIQRFALVPAEGEPIICQRELSRKSDYRSLRFDAYMFAMRPPIATQDFVAQVIAGLKELGAAGERVGVDYLNLAAIDGLKAAGIHLVDGCPAILQARVVKTTDELQLIRWTTKAKARGYDLVREELRKADPPEDKLSRIMLDYLMDQGFEAGSEFISIYDSSLADTRPHNEPMGADLVVRDGDLVICDATVAGPGGYYSDFARTFSRGAPTAGNQTTLQGSLSLAPRSGEVGEARLMRRSVRTFRQKRDQTAARLRRLSRRRPVYLRITVAARRRPGENT